MSVGSQQIVCRRCKEVISIDEGSCPHCGASIRGNLPFFAVIVVGIVIMGASLLNLSELLAYGVLGLLLAVGSGYMFYEKRQRMQQANERSSSVEDTL